jgi:hypothetical protein
MLLLHYTVEHSYMQQLLLLLPLLLRAIGCWSSAAVVS